jgi:hypothetical protein
LLGRDRHRAPLSGPHSKNNALGIWEAVLTISSTCVNRCADAMQVQLFM